MAGEVESGAAFSPTKMAGEVESDLYEIMMVIQFGIHSKPTWLALEEDHAALSCRVEQLIALLRPVKPWHRPLGGCAA